MLKKELEEKLKEYQELNEQLLELTEEQKLLIDSLREDLEVEKFHGDHISKELTEAAKQQTEHLKTIKDLEDEDEKRITDLEEKIYWLKKDCELYKSERDKYKQELRRVTKEGSIDDLGYIFVDNADGICTITFNSERKVLTKVS